PQSVPACASSRTIASFALSAPIAFFASSSAAAAAEAVSFFFGAAPSPVPAIGNGGGGLSHLFTRARVISPSITLGYAAAPLGGLYGGASLAGDTKRRPQSEAPPARPP